MHRLLLFITAMAMSVLAVTAGTEWNCRVWRFDSGLLDNRVVGVKQASDGFLWVATVSGVMRFDGLDFRTLDSSYDLSPSEKIDAFFIDSLDRLWLTRQEGQVHCIDHGSVVLRVQPPSDFRNQGRPSIVEENEGKMSVCFPGGGILRIREGSAERLTEPSATGRQYKEVVKDGLGRIWFSKGAHGFGMIIDGEASLLESRPVHRLAGARSGGVWGCSDNELWRYTEDGYWEGVKRLPEELSNISLMAFYEDSRGGLWLGSDGAGLFYFDGSAFSKVPSSSLRILSVDEDMDGTLWIGTVDGLNQLKPAVVNFFGAGPDKRFENVISLAEDKAGHYWVVWNTGLVSKSRECDLLRSGPLGNRSLMDAKTIPAVQCVVADAQGGVWLGTETSGVFRFQDGVVTTNISVQNGFSAEDVKALHVTQEGVLWIGARNPAMEHSVLRSWQSGMLRSYTLPKTSGHISAIISDSFTNCWCATHGGDLFRVDRDGVLTNETGTLSSGRWPILSLCATPDGSVWLGFSGQGLGRLKDGRFTQYRTEQGLRDDSISRVLFDGSGRLWFAGYRGICSVLQKDFDAVDEGLSTRVQSVAYGTNEGLPSSRATSYFWPGAIRDKAGRLFFGMAGGLAVITPGEAMEPQIPPSVVIDRVSVDGRVIASWGADERLSGVPQTASVNLRTSGKNRLRLPPGSSHLELAFTALSFKLPESTLFRCRMLGLNEEWSDVGSQRTISYFNMSPGDYHFQVLARNSDGVWSTYGAVCDFSVMPYFWQTLWFKALGVTGAMTGLWLVTWGMLRSRNRRKLALLEHQQAVERERGRIARDMHDDLGAGLTQISMDVAMLQKPVVTPVIAGEIMKEIDQRARDLVKSLDALVWAVNPKNDTVRAMTAYFADFAQSFLRPVGLVCRLNVASDIPDAPVSAERRHGLYLAFKEALHNVLQHAAATEVLLEIRIDGRALVIVLADNGRGFEAGPVAAGSDGLLNMRTRLNQMGGSCVVESDLGCGTRVTFNFPLKG